MSGLRLPTEREVWAFCQQIPIATKDFGVRPIEGWGTQRRLVREILEGKAKGINQYVVVKARQVGASTIMLLLTLLWMWRFPGLQGLTVTDGEENKQYFRDLFLMMVEHLAELQEEGEAPNFQESGTTQQTVRARNTVQINWKNQSRLLLQMAGPRTWSRLGVGRGLSFLHGTEVGLWSKGERAVTYLRSAFSEINPAALYIFEGTARGKNWYYDLWLSAEKAKTIKAVFLSWWMREDNRIPKTKTTIWKAYGDPRLTAKEREWAAVLKRRDKVVLELGQWVWRRWYLMEKAGGNHRLADQEQPTIWEDAFSASQDRPFLDPVLTARLETVVSPPDEAHLYRWGSSLEDTQLAPVPERVSPMLQLWSRPDHRPVVVAAVPAHSIVEDDPNWVISVWAADLERERLEQVAEFCTDLTVGLQPFAWTCLHLAASYPVPQQCFILEISGLGMGVLGEIRRLIQSGWGARLSSGFTQLLGGIHHYIWRRADSLAGMGAYQWKSTPELQATLLHRLRDQLVRGVVRPRSAALLTELDRLEGHGEGYDPAGETPRGHRAYAAALAVEAYSNQLYPTLKRYRPDLSSSSVAQRTVQRFFAGLNGPKLHSPR